MKPPCHVPLRTCMGCGERDEQPKLIRVGCDATGRLIVVSSVLHRGRSGYLHPRRQCCSRFAARKGPIRSLRRSIDRVDRKRFVEGLEIAEPSASNLPDDLALERRPAE